MTIMKKLPLYITILIGMLVGTGLGFWAVAGGWEHLLTEWIKPWGTIFIRLLRLVAVPLVVVSLISGITNLSDTKHLSRMGLKTLGIYLSTTVFAIVIGLVVVNLIRPGEVFPREKTAEFRSRYEQSVSEKATAAENMREDSPLQFLVDMVPENIILKIIEYVMKLAPLGVMALMADLIVGFAGDSDLLLALGYYALTVVIGLCVILLICYPLIIRFFTDIRLPDYVRAVLPVQMLAFTSCSSAACLPVNIEQMRRLGLPHNVISFVLPTGVTVNMNGTSCYHAIATVFVAQVMGIELSLAQMLSIVVLTTVSSIGTPGIPSGGMAVLTLVLVSVGIPAEGIAMIIAMDRPLDMLITAVNVSGDAMAACVVSRGERSESAETVISAHTNTEQS